MIASNGIAIEHLHRDVFRKVRSRDLRPASSRAGDKMGMYGTMRMSKIADVARDFVLLDHK